MFFETQCSHEKGVHPFVCLSMKRVDCYKTKAKCVQIF